MRNWFRYTASPSAHGGHLERHDIGAEDGVADVGGALDGDGADLLVAEGVGQHRAEGAEEEKGHQAGQPALIVVQAGVVADGRPGEHDAEQQEHDDGADVDEHLDPGHELGRQEDVQRRGAGQDDGEEQRGAYDVGGGHQAERGRDHDDGEDAEDDVLGDHGGDASSWSLTSS
jgi:hypothetical protein